MFFESFILIKQHINLNQYKCFIYSNIFFCNIKVEWLSGDVCKYMGIMVVVSSETSVFTMVLLTSIRLIAVMNVSFNFFIVVYCRSTVCFFLILTLILLFFFCKVIFVQNINKAFVFSNKL